MLSARPSVFAAAVIAALSFASAAQAGCKGGICVSGQDNGSVVTVTYQVQTGPVTNVNIRTPDGRQFEGGASGTFSVQRFANTVYAIQKCVKGTGLFGRSTCGPWVSFTHHSST